MLLARLVTGRYGYEPGEGHAPVARPRAKGWLRRLAAAIFSRKKS